MSKKDSNYKTLTIEAATTGWIIRESGKPAEIFHIWSQVIRKLETELTNKSIKV